MLNRADSAVAAARSGKSKDSFGNHLANRRNIGARNKLKLHPAQSGEPQFEFAVQIDCASSFNGERLDFAVRQRRVIHFFAGDSLNVNSKNRSS